MRTRNNRVVFYLNDKKFEDFEKKAKRTSRSREAFVRKAIQEVQIKELPPADLPRLIFEIHRVGNNIDALVDQLIPKEPTTITQVFADKLKPFPLHPFKVLDDDDMEQLTQSIQAQGVLTPLVIRPLGNGEYEVISGHRRLHACKKAGIKTVPALITAMDRDAAAIALVDSNLHRENILPSEKAFSYKPKLDALKHQGQTCGQVGHKSRDMLADDESGRQVQRYIRLTNLIPELLQKVDTGQIALSPGVELSYLDADTQRFVLEAMDL